MLAIVQTLFRASAGFVGGAVVGIVGCIALVIGLDLISMLLSFLTGHQLPGIVIGFLSENGASRSGDPVLTNGILQIVGFLGALVGAIRMAMTSHVSQA